MTKFTTEHLAVMLNSEDTKIQAIATTLCRALENCNGGNSNYSDGNIGINCTADKIEVVDIEDNVTIAEISIRFI